MTVVVNVMVDGFRDPQSSAAASDRYIRFGSAVEIRTSGYEQTVCSGNLPQFS